MSGDIHKIVELVSDLNSAGCGYTVDKFTDSDKSFVVQWVWALPNSTSSGPNSHQLAESLLSKWSGGGGGINAAFDSGLTDEIGVVEECPFQPKLCSGPHVVTTGIFASPLEIPNFEGSNG